jgi:hypothetical protein
MIPVTNPLPEPATFESNCRTPGNAWLAANPTAKSKSFPSYWIHFEDDIAKGFQFRCGWLGFEITEGDIDHYLSKQKHRNKTYEWSNYRYIAGSVNSSKRTQDANVLDPFDVQDGWFILGLPDMQLRGTNAIPIRLRDKAKYTIEKLKLNARKHRRTRYVIINGIKTG